MEEQLDPLTQRIIGCAITVHRFLGPGLLESIYRTALSIELRFNEIPFERVGGVAYRGITVGDFRQTGSNRDTRTPIGLKAS